jgi:hypothetical protein
MKVTSRNRVIGLSNSQLSAASTGGASRHGDNQDCMAALFPTNLAAIRLLPAARA